MRVAADDRCARLGEAELWPNDVDDPLVRRLPAVEWNAELVAVRLKLLHLCRRHLVGDRQVAWCGWDGVVGGSDCFIWATHRQAARPETGERLRAGHLVDQVQVDREDGGRPLVLAHHMLIPDLLDDCLRHAASVPERRGATVRQGRARIPP